MALMQKSLSAIMAAAGLTLYSVSLSNSCELSSNPRFNEYCHLRWEKEQFDKMFKYECADFGRLRKADGINFKTYSEINEELKKYDEKSKAYSEIKVILPGILSAFFLAGALYKNKY